MSVNNHINTDTLDTVLGDLLEQVSEAKHDVVHLVEDGWRQYYELSEQLERLKEKTNAASSIEEQKLDHERQTLMKQLTDLQQLIEKAEAMDRKVSIVSDYLQGDPVQSVDIKEDVRFKQNTGFRIIEAQEDERKKLSHDIHDGPAQNLANLVLNAELIEQLYIKGHTQEALQELGTLRDKIRDILQDVRNIIYDLRPTSLEKFGIWPTLDRFLKRLQNERNVTIHFDDQSGDVELSKEVESSLFRFVQEAVQNACYHGQPKQVDVQVEVRDNLVLLNVEDDGVGFDVNEKKDDSFGIIGMKERVDLLNGYICVDSTKGVGTKVMIQIPRCHKKEEA